MTNFRQIFENDFCGTDKFLDEVLKPIFGDYEKGYDELTSGDDEKERAKSANIEKIRHAASFDFFGSELKVFDVTVSDRKKLENNRVGIQAIVRQYIAQFEGALIVFHHQNVENKEWRLSYVEKRTGAKDSTSAKRYTYILGKGHPAKTISERFKELESKKDNDEAIILQALTNAFSIAPLSDDFFDEYREHYADLVEYISGKRFIKKGGKFVEEKTKNANGAFKDAFGGDDKLVRDFVKKMMGRLVFLHFLQKKGWLGVPQNAEWGSGDKNFIYNLFENASEDVKKDFLEQALEPLFFKTLNTDRGKDALAPKVLCDIYGRKIRIPYLNGGLFEEDELDKKKVKFKKEHFKALLEFFSQYNFTIDETDPDDQEIGVDPEMLGKIFENLLEDNKDKGAFYTPKEIVQYMCRESLIAYLEEKTKIAARDFVIKHEENFTKTQKDEVLKSIREVKVCDPAVGSGAFPMGMMNELLACAQILTGNAMTRADLKKHIVKNNIYGVDIEKGAVDIARLRFWLAIIVDEEEPLPLPNLDYKIMQGNSLLESYEGIDLACLTKERVDNNGKKADDGKKGTKHYENDLLVYGDDGKVVDHVTELIKKLDSYYQPHDHEAKKQIDQEIQKLARMILSDKFADKRFLDKLEKEGLKNNSNFFLWHVWFNDVFSRPNDCNGFDIVMGNPPYIFARDAHFSEDFKKDIQRDYYSKLADRNKSKASQSGKINLFALFIMKGIMLSNKNGILSYIVPNNILRTTTYDLVRRYILDNTSVSQIVDLGSGIFEKVTASTITLQLLNKKDKNNEVLILTDAKSLNPIEATLSRIPQAQFLDNTSYAFNIYVDLKSINLTRKMELNSKLFGDYCIDIIEGIVAKKSLISTESGKNRFPMLEGKCIKKYSIIGINKYIEWNVPEIHRTRPNYLWEQNEKLVTQRISGGSHPIIVAYDTFKYKAFASVNNIVLKEEYRHLYKFFLALLNSNVLNWYYANNFSNNSDLTVNISKTYLEKLPIPPFNITQQKPIIALVDKILAAKNSNPQEDTSTEEAEINRLVYQLYGLTEEEIKVVEER